MVNLSHGKCTLCHILADKIDSFKKPVASTVSSVSLSDSKSNKITTASAKQNGSVLGASTGPTVNSNNQSNNPMDSVFNMCMEALAFLVRNWKWTLGVIVVLFLLLKIIF